MSKTFGKWSLDLDGLLARDYPLSIRELGNYDPAVVDKCGGLPVIDAVQADVKRVFATPDGEKASSLLSEYCTPTFLMGPIADVESHVKALKARATKACRPDINPFRTERYNPKRLVNATWWSMLKYYSQDSRDVSKLYNEWCLAEDESFNARVSSAWCDEVNNGWWWAFVDGADPIEHYPFEGHNTNVVDRANKLQQTVGDLKNHTMDLRQFLALAMRRLCGKHFLGLGADGGAVFDGKRRDSLKLQGFNPSPMERTSGQETHTIISPWNTKDIFINYRGDPKENETQPAFMSMMPAWNPDATTGEIPLNGFHFLGALIPSIRSIVTYEKSTPDSFLTPRTEQRVGNPFGHFRLAYGGFIPPERSRK